ncbi:hypothetical protein D3C87_77700 [compost metagenome]
MGYLPERIFLYCKKPKDQVINNDVEEDEDQLEAGVRKAFPVSDQSAQSRHENAERWAITHEYNYTSRKSTESPGDMFEYQNSGFSDVTIKSLDIRGQGGRAYQVVMNYDNKKFQVDLREDALLDVIYNTGIEAGGKLNGTFCFIVEGSQTNLVRENSEVWKSAQKGAEARKSTTIKKSELKVGHLYKTLSGETAIYLGEAYARSLTFKEDKNSYKHNGKLECGKVAKKMIFLKTYSYDTAKQVQQDLDKFKNKKIDNYRIEIQVSHSYREDLGLVQVIDIDEVIDIIHDMGSRYYEEQDGSVSSYGSENMLRACVMTEVSKDKNIKINQSKIDKAVSVYDNYVKNRRRY